MLLLVLLVLMMMLLLHYLSWRVRRDRLGPRTGAASVQRKRWSWRWWWQRRRGPRSLPFHMLWLATLVLVVVEVGVAAAAVVVVVVVVVAVVVVAAAVLPRRLHVTAHHRLDRPRLCLDHSLPGLGCCSVLGRSLVGRRYALLLLFLCLLLLLPLLPNHQKRCPGLAISVGRRRRPSCRC
jgi:hypothetical protein